MLSICLSNFSESFTIMSVSPVRSDLLTSESASRSKRSGSVYRSSSLSLFFDLTDLMFAKVALATVPTAVELEI
jgi:hypothetical protein